MSPTETIAEAIEKLEKLRAEATPGPWVVTYERSRHPRIWGNRSEDAGEADAVAQTEGGTGNAHLIVVLHRTIDAQLAILRLAAEYLPITSGFRDRALLLARAILGAEVSS